ACGLPGIVSEIPPYSSPQPTGIVTVPNETKAWAEALNDLCASEDLARMGQAAREWAEAKFDVTVFDAELTEQIMAEEAS
ncbi:MAG: hypothetical protein ACRDLB_04210, partial [Actinomycetota bacterium]